MFQGQYRLRLNLQRGKIKSLSTFCNMS